MAERIEQYLDTVGAQVRWKRVRPALTQELRTHLEEQAEAYRAEGLPAAEAEAEAVRQMGDAEQIGLALDAVHRPKRQTAILSLAGICILLGAIFRILSQDSPKLFTLAALVLTAGLLLGGYYFDYRRLARYAWQIYGVVLALGAVCLYRSFHLANGIGIELGISMGTENEYVVLLFPLAYALAVYALRGKRGGFVLALYAGVPFIAFLHLSDMAPIYQVSFFSRLMLRVGLTAVLLIAIRAGFFRVKAGWACAAVLALLALGVYRTCGRRVAADSISAPRPCSCGGRCAEAAVCRSADEPDAAAAAAGRALVRRSRVGLEGAAVRADGGVSGAGARAGGKADLSAGEAAVPAGRAPARHPVRAGVRTSSVCSSSRAAAVHHRKPLLGH
ncbi:MAG: permease prefix domain 1-containing protein [Oscillospiraceae bacterium]